MASARTVSTSTAFALGRAKKRREVTRVPSVPKKHELLAAFPVPAEAGLPKSIGAMVISAQMSRLFKEACHVFGDHASLKIALLPNAEGIEATAGGPAYEGELEALDLVRFADSVGAKRTRGSKIGGLPFHYNEPPSIPTCDRCARTLVWGAHLAADLFDETFGDSGSLAIYVCPIGCQAKSAIDRA